MALTAEEETAVVAAEQGVATVYDPNTKNGFPIVRSTLRPTPSLRSCSRPRVLQIVRAFHGLGW